MVFRRLLRNLVGTYPSRSAVISPPEISLEPLQMFALYSACHPVNHSYGLVYLQCLHNFFGIRVRFFTEITGQGYVRCPIYRTDVFPFPCV